MKKTKVGVVVDDHKGETSLVQYVIEVTQNEYDLGYHFDKAEIKASQEGYEPIRSFSEDEPISKFIKWIV